MARPNLINNGWLPSGAPWAEYIGKAGSTSDAQLGWEQGNQAVMSILVNHPDWVSGRVAVDLLGVNAIQPGLNSFTRTPPVRHPYLPHLYADRITGARPVQWQAKLKTTSIPYSAYQFALVTVLFRQPRFRVLTDADLDRAYPPVTGVVRQEWQRFVEWRWQPSGEFVTRDVGSFKWAETAAGGPVVGAGFPSSLGQFLAKATILAKWMRVPYSGLFGGFGIPTNVRSRVGCVNNASFMGFAAGTLLLMPPEFEAVEVPDFGSVGGSGGVTGFPLAYNVTLPFLLFGPPAGATSQGHNLAPNPGDNLWYLVTVDGTPGGSRIFPSTDFTAIFIPSP